MPLRGRTHRLVSAASAWEIATKVRLGKLPTAANFVADFSGQIEREGVQLLAISADHAIRAFEPASCRDLTATPSIRC